MPEPFDKPSTPPKRPLKVFLCHATADKPKVRELYRYLKKRGIQPWLDAEDLLPGQNWQTEIPKAIESSDAIIICLSKGSVDKEGFVQKEIKFALDKALEMPEGRIFIIPMRLDECEVPNSLDSYHWVDLFADGGYERLMRSLKMRVAQLERSQTETPIVSEAETWHDWRKAAYIIAIVGTGLGILAILIGFLPEIFKSANVQTKTMTAVNTAIITLTPKPSLAPNPKILTTSEGTHITSYEVGQEFILDIRFEGNGYVDGAQTKVMFNPNDLEVVNIINGPAFLGVLISRFDNNNGWVEYHAANTISPTPPPSPVTFFVIKFRVKRLFSNSLIYINPEETVIVNLASTKNDSGNAGEVFLVVK